MKWTLLSLCRRPHSVSPSVRSHCVFHSVQRGDATRYSRRRNHVWTVPPSHLPQLLIQTRKQGKIIVFNAWKKYNIFVRQACRLFYEIFVTQVYIQMLMWIDLDFIIDLLRHTGIKKPTMLCIQIKKIYMLFWKWKIRNKVFKLFYAFLDTQVKSILKYLFPVPKEESKRVITFANDDDFISFR